MADGMLYIAITPKIPGGGEVGISEVTMGWVSLLEDTVEKIADNIRLAESALKEKENPSEEDRRASLKALNDAKAILNTAWQHLELATSPELDLAHEIRELRKQYRGLEFRLKVAEQNAKKAEFEAANHYAELQDANREIAALKKEKRKLEKDFERVAHKDYASAVEAFSSPGMQMKHKPKR